VTPDRLPAAIEILDQVLDQLPPAVALASSPGVRVATLRTISADLRRYLEFEADNDCGWDQAGLELRFGFEDGEQQSLPPLTLGTGERQLRMRGVIDRVDTDGHGHAIVRDYKSGSQRPSQRVDRWREDRSLQVALYMLVVRKLLGLEPVAGLYQPLGGRDLRARGVFRDDVTIGARTVANDARDSEAFEEVLDDAGQRALGLAERLRAGELKPCPENCSRDGCAYPGICRA
jgi:hypothetical protein